MAPAGCSFISFCLSGFSASVTFNDIVSVFLVLCPMYLLNLCFFLCWFIALWRTTAFPHHLNPQMNHRLPVHEINLNLRSALVKVDFPNAAFHVLQGAGEDSDPIPFDDFHQGEGRFRASAGDLLQPRGFLLRQRQKQVPFLPAQKSGKRGHLPQGLIKLFDGGTGEEHISRDEFFMHIPPFSPQLASYMPERVEAAAVETAVHPPSYQFFCTALRSRSYLNHVVQTAVPLPAWGFAVWSHRAGESVCSYSPCSAFPA